VIPHTFIFVENQVPFSFFDRIKFELCHCRLPTADGWKRCGTKPGNLQTEEWHVITSGVHQTMFENVSMGSDMIDLQLLNPPKNNY